MEIIKYPDGSSYAKVNLDSNPNFTFKINSYEDIWHLHQIVDAFNSLGVVPTVTIPKLIDAQADRRFEKDESSGLKLVCNFLNSMNANFQIFHPHNPEIVESLIDKVEIISNHTEFIPKVLLYLGKKLNPTGSNQNNLFTLLPKNLILMSSDAGGFKPLVKLCDKIGWKGETYSASKSRKYANGKSFLTQIVDKQDFEGKDILIIDDICVYGGTFKGLAKLLRERNCGKLYLAVSHMTVQNLGDDPVTNYFDKVFSTNSKHDYYITYNNLKGVNGVHPKSPANLEILKLF